MHVYAMKIFVIKRECDLNLSLLISEIMAYLQIFIFILFFYFWLCWVFVAVCRLSLVVASGGCSSCGCVGFSLW